MKAQRLRLLSLIIAIMLAASMTLSIHAVNDTKYNIAVRKFIKLNDTWSKTGNGAEFEDKDYPDFYGGMWFGDDDSLVIAVVDINEQIKEYFSNIIDMTDVVFIDAKYSYNELMKEKYRIRGIMELPQDDKTDAEKAVNGYGIYRNRIHLTINCDDMALAEEYSKSITSFDTIIELGSIGPAIPIDEPLECIDVGCEE